MILGYLLFTRNDLSLVVNVLLTKAFQPMFPVISSFFFSLSKKITLVEGLTIGSFNGDIDEVRISNKIREYPE
jgi:hypothetical protein